ncbi:MAG TPA: multidrug effflux MFS transporter [Azospirillaceae bacterium]|nr:multidrug effflux MFS transporter [Azospirillaceae bacterium]
MQKPVSPPSAPPARFALGIGEFVTLIALLMAIPALGIDIMLPVLPDIAASYQVASANDRQLVVTAFMLGFAVGQPFYGPLSDRFGRKPIMVVGLLIFALGAAGAVIAPSFEALLAARALQGVGAAAMRVITLTVVRDRFAGREMARIMSFIILVFIMVPMLAPSLGTLVARVGGWPWIFGFLLVAGLAALTWMLVRLPETQAPEDRMPLSPAAIGGAVAFVVTNREAMGYTVAGGFMFGGIMSYVGSSQQIFVDVYGLGDLFPIVFGGIAGVMAVATLLNARLVGRLGMRRVSHAALLVFLAACGAMALAGFPPAPPLPVLLGFLGLAFFCNTLMMPNFNAIAMQPVGHIAGTASSFMGFYGTAAGAGVGWLIGQAFDGTLRPLVIGYTVLGLLTLATVLVTERGRLMRRTERPGGQPAPDMGH